MAIGTTLKLGFDASAVKKGFALLPRMFSKSMGFLGKNVLGGAAQKIGHGVTDLLGKAIMAVPQGISDMTDYAGALVDVSTQTKVAIKDLMVLQEAMRLSGAEGDTARMISTFAKNMRTAMTEEGGANDAIRRLGFSPDEFKGLKADEMFRKVGMAAKDFNGDVGELEDIMSELFGARMGYKLIRFFSDFEGNMKQARNNVGEWGDHMQANAQKIDDTGDALGRFRLRWLQLMEVISSELGLGGSGDFVNKAFDWLNPERVREFVKTLKEGVTTAFNWVKDGGFQKLFQDLGRHIADGLKNSLGESFSLKGMWRAAFGKDKPAAQDRTTSQLLEQSRQQTRSLARIENKGFPAYAV